MKAVSLSSPSLRPCSGHRKIIQRKNYRTLASRREAHEPNYDYGGRLVDESMIVLRKILHEMKMVERNYEPSSHWMDWEKRYYTSYDSVICKVVGFLQSQLTNTRPTLASVFMALLTFSVPTTMAILFYQMLKLTKLITAAIHLARAFPNKYKTVKRSHKQVARLQLGAWPSSSAQFDANDILKFSS
ncbi:hypothetical protein RJ641_012741 [Dillenia turbinata]|uniref:Uncharacterized protein n=1 Tax=Dillenia turbinata TaxID=194707 RepID=A0AAN8UZT0_9MAGN